MERVLLWISVGVLALGFLANAYLIKRVSDRKGMCVVDLVSVASEIVKNVNSENFTREEADRIMREIRSYMDPKAFGCSYIFVKGALIRGEKVIDITEQVKEYARKVGKGTSQQ